MTFYVFKEKKKNYTQKSEYLKNIFEKQSLLTIPIEIL
jgi:hypothetical protein